MVLVFLLVGFPVAFALHSAFKAFSQAKSKGERSLIVRIALFSFLSILFVGALLLRAPIKYILLAAVPIFFLTAVANRVFDAARKRVRQTPPPDIERMKRLN